MSWLKKMLGLQARHMPAQSVARERPLGLDNGKSVTVDASLALVLQDHLSQPAFTGHQCIWSSGEIDLGQDNFLQRFYLEDNENWLQVHTTGGVDGQAEALILFNYASAVVITSEAELARLAGPGSPIGQPTYCFAGNQFAREWGTEAGQTALISYSERVTSPREAYVVKHHAMLYARDTALANRREFLLFSAEEDQEGAVTLTTSVGVSLYTTDLTVTF